MQVTISKLPHTPRTKKVIENAIVAAKELGHNYVGTEHLLLGFLMVADGTGAEVLKALGVDFDKAQQATLEMLGYTNKHKRTYTAIALAKDYYNKTETSNLGEFQTAEEADEVGRKFMADYPNCLAVTVSYTLERKEVTK
jgi:ATP-dependent Clp protease ATP-binding subunit ClpA